MKFGNGPSYRTGLPVPNPTTPTRYERFGRDEIPTQPELVAQKEVSDERDELLKLFASHEREIISKISEVDKIDLRFLDKMREGHSKGRMMFAEYYCKLARVGYIYFDREFEGELPPDKRRHVPVQAHGQTVLLRVKNERHVGAIYLWNDENKDE